MEFFEKHKKPIGFLFIVFWPITVIIIALINFEYSELNKELKDMVK